MYSFDQHRLNPDGLPPGAIPLRNVANVLDEGRLQLVYGACIVIAVPATGCLGLLMGPLLIVDAGHGVWLAVLLAVALLMLMGVAVWFGIRKIQEGRRNGLPALQYGWVNGDRIDLVFADGSLRTLSLHSPRLGLQHVNRGGRRQVVLGGVGVDGRPVAVVMTDKERDLMSPRFRQPDPALWGIITATERSPYPAGRLVADGLRHLLGTQNW